MHILAMESKLNAVSPNRNPHLNDKEKVKT